MRPAPMTRMRSAPRCTAGEIGAAWRIEPSPKYSVRPSIVQRAPPGTRTGSPTRPAGAARRSRRAPRCAASASTAGCSVDRVVEGHVQARAVARRGDGQRLQMAFAASASRSRSLLTMRLQQVGERRVVEQRARPRAAPARDHPAERQHRQPARAGADHAERVGAVDLLGVEVLPHLARARAPRRRSRRRGRPAPRR